MKIGIVDLDTSHPQNWVPLERQLGHEVVGVWDGGSVHPAEYAERFADEHGIPRLFKSLEEMAAAVDCAVIHGCDWDTHVDKARPFVQAGKSVLLDKPLAGNISDLNQLRQWVRQGARITGGSSLRFCREARAWLGRAVDDRGTPHTAFVGCGVDPFNYGIHAYALLSALMGPGIETVRHIGEHVQHRVQVSWSDGRMGFLVIGRTDHWLPFHASVATEREVTQFRVDPNRLYAALLEATLPYLAREVDKPPLPFDQLVEPELCALAARRSWTEEDREVVLTELSAADEGYDGAAFAAGYRKARYPG